MSEGGGVANANHRLPDCQHCVCIWPKWHFVSARSCQALCALGRTYARKIKFSSEEQSRLKSCNPSELCVDTCVWNRSWVSSSLLQYSACSFSVQSSIKTLIAEGSPGYTLYRHPGAKYSSLISTSFKAVVVCFMFTLLPFSSLTSTLSFCLIIQWFSAWIGHKTDLC